MSMNIAVNQSRNDASLAAAADIQSPGSIADIIQCFNQRTAASKRMAAENKAYLADKSSIGLAFSSTFKEACYPVVAERAAGAYLWDTDGNQYIDILNGLGTNLFGHNPAFIREAINLQLEKGFPIGPQSELAGATAQRFCELTNMQRVTFSNTGSEAVMTALRIARTATGRDTIAVFSNSYHGHFDAGLMRIRLMEHWRRRAIQIGEHNSLLKPLRPLLQKCLISSSHPAVPGIPKAVAKNVMVLDYNNPRSLQAIRRHAKRLAAVLVEPVQSRCPEIQPRDFLQELRTLTANHGIKLIFDEMVTGFRIHPGGAQAYFGVEADLATYSKIAGGGLALSIIAGRNDIMNHIDGGPWQFGDDSSPQTTTTFFAGTFCRHPLSLIAAKATAEYLLAEGPALQEDLNQKTCRLIGRLNQFSQHQRLPIRFVNFGSFFAIDLANSQLSSDAQTALSLQLLNQGIHLRGGDKGGFLSTAHSEQDIEAIYQAFCAGLMTINAIGLLQKTSA